jgi:hypothetical protein
MATNNGSLNSTAISGMTDDSGNLFGSLPSNIRALTKIADRAVEAGNPDYLPALFCHVGMPRSNYDGLSFERQSGTASLHIAAGKTFDGKGWQQQPIPYGTIPRLALIHITSEAVRTQSPIVDVGTSVYSFLEALGVGNNQAARKRAREQMIALGACTMRLGRVLERDGKQFAQTMDAKPFNQFEAWIDDTEGQSALWPTFITLTEPFFDEIIKSAVPLRHDALAQLSGSALALDIYCWLAHRLCRVKRSGADISWAALEEQFGQEYGDRKDFKRSFIAQLHKVLKAYPEARVEIIHGGLRLATSPTPIPRSTVTRFKPKPKKPK